jgi:dTDP-4-dehydrorhamnose reductase
MPANRVLVLGATGLLGSALSPALRSAGFDVVRHGGASPADVNADLRDRTAAFAALDKAAAGTIVNLVALTDVDLCEARPDEAYAVNARTAENVAEWTRAHAGTRLVHVSTDQVYDGEGPHPEDRISPVNIYAYSKYCSELLARTAGATVLRTNFFGPIGHRRKSFSEWIAAGIRGGTELRLVTDVLFSPLHIDTLCGLMARVVARPVEGVFNLGSHDGMSKWDFGTRMALELGLDTAHIRSVRMSDLGLEARRPGDMRMVVSRFESAFGARLPTLDDEIRLLKKQYAGQTQH